MQRKSPGPRQALTFVPIVGLQSITTIVASRQWQGRRGANHKNRADPGNEEKANR